MCLLISFSPFFFCSFQVFRYVGRCSISPSRKIRWWRASVCVHEQPKGTNCIMIFLILSSHNYNSSCVFFPYLPLNRITMERRWKNWSLLMSNYLFWLADTTQPHARINFRWSKGEGFLVRLCHGKSRGFKQRRLPRYFKYAKWLWRSMTKEEIRAARTNRKIKLNSKPAKPTWNSREIETK